MRTTIAVLAGLLGVVPPAAAFSPHQVFMLLAAFQTYQSECAAAAPAFSTWDAAALDRLAARFGVEIKEAENVQRLFRYTQRMRDAIEPAGQKVWCVSVRGQLESILKGLGNS